jgi:hypothetical protein
VFGNHFHPCPIFSGKACNLPSGWSSYSSKISTRSDIVVVTDNGISDSSGIADGNEEVMLVMLLM